MNKFDEQKALRAEAFFDTLKLLEKEDIKKKLENSRTRLYREDKEIEIEKQNRRGEILVLKTSTLNASKNFKDKVCILNFASATNPGGGVKNGSNAQEESICRVTSLYKELSTQFLFDNFYMYHRERKNTLYTDRIIYSENVLVLKEDFAPYNTFSEDSQRFINVITSPAPNIRNLQGIKEEELLDILTSRIIRILEVAIENKNTNIVLGAFGCGAFGNPPKIVAKAFKNVLFDKNYRRYFDTIIFAILDGKNTNNFETFESILRDPQLIDCRPEIL